MKFWKKIFLYSVVLFLILLTLAGSILIENTFKYNLNETIKTTLYKFTDVENTLYLNADYLLDVDVKDKESIRKWMNIIVKGYALSRNEDPFFLELYTTNDEKILSDMREKIEMPREELKQQESGEKVFIIREVGGKQYVFVGGKINLKNEQFKMIISRDINAVYVRRVKDYEVFFFINAGISIVLAIGMFIIARSLTRPLVTLTKVSKEIAAGDYSRRMKESGYNDEVGILECNFNKMVDVIEENIMELRYHNEAKQRFIDSLNHEIKTPITSIIGYSDLLLRSKVDEKTKKKALLYINSEAKRLGHLNSTLLKLTFIREEAIEKDYVSLTECVINAVNTLKYKAENKELCIEIEVEEVFVFVDANQLELLLVNILDNACKASLREGRIKVYGMVNDISKGYSLLIEDFGIGIAKNDLDKIMEPFYMADKSRTRKDNGIGLGLAICSEISKINQIAIGFSSEIGKGTKVSLTFCKENIRHEK